MFAQQWNHLATHSSEGILLVNSWMTVVHSPSRELSNNPDLIRCILWVKTYANPFPLVDSLKFAGVASSALVI